MSRRATQKTLDFESPEAFEDWKRGIKAEILAKAKMPPHLRRLMERLAWYANGKHSSFPSIRTLARDLGYLAWPSAKYTLIKQINRLEELGLLRRKGQKKRSDGGDSVNEYRFLWGNLQATYMVGPAPKRLPPPWRPGSKIVRREPSNYVVSSPAPVNPSSPGRLTPVHRAGEPQLTGPVNPGSPAYEKNKKQIRKDIETIAPLPPEVCTVETEAKPEVTSEATRGEASAVLVDFGIEAQRHTLAQAQAAGVTFARVIQLTEVAKSAGRDGKGVWRIKPGMLFDRIVNDLPGRDPATGWHPLAQTALKVARAREAAKLALARGPAVPVPASRSPTVTETSSGDKDAAIAILDALSVDDFSELMDAANLSPIERRAIKQHGRRASLTQSKLLRMLAQRQPAQSPGNEPCQPLTDVARDART